MPTMPRASSFPASTIQAGASAPASDNGKVPLQPEWGTRQRIAALIETLDDGDIDELVDKSTRMGGGPKIIKGFHPQSTWLWRQWYGTVLEQTWQPALGIMFLCLLLCSGMELVRTWPALAVPNEAHEVVLQLRGLNNMWGYLLTMAGFVNSFFLSQACTLHPCARTRSPRALRRAHTDGTLRPTARVRAQTASGWRPRATFARCRGA